MKFYKEYNYVHKLIRECFGKKADIMIVQGTWTGEKKIKGAGIDIQWPIPTGSTITKRHRAIATSFIKKYISESLKITMATGNNIDATYCIFISAREW